MVGKYSKTNKGYDYLVLKTRQEARSMSYLSYQTDKLKNAICVEWRASKMELI